MSWPLIVNGDAMRRWRRYASQAVELYDVYQTKVAPCDKQIEVILKRLRKSATPPASKLLPPKHKASVR